MRQVEVVPESAVGREVEVLIVRGEWRGCGQGGVLESATGDVVAVRNPLGDVRTFARADVTVSVLEPYAASECLEHGHGGCAGAVDYRYPLSGTGRSFPRCDAHWSARVREQDRITRLYGGHTPPADWSPLDAGEAWDED